MTMMNSSSSVITQFTWAGFAFAGYPVDASAALYFASSQPLISWLPMRVTTSAPSIAGRDANEMPALPRKSFALSHADWRDHGPMKMWKLQSLAATDTGVLSW